MALDEDNCVKVDEGIDLAAVNATLVTLGERIETATSKHNEFLTELGLSLLPK